MLNKKFIAAAFAAAFAVPGVSVAQEAASPHTLTGNLTFTTDYVFRGISQTMEEPAVQGGFDYTHASGAYLGVWGSNISGRQFPDGSMELDLYGGYAKSFGDFGVNGGAIYFAYPGAEYANGDGFDTLELYVGGSWKWLSAKLSYAVTDFFGANAQTNAAQFSEDSDGSLYIELNATYPISDVISLAAHVGQQTVEGTAAGVDLDYVDYKVGVNYLYKGYTFSLAYKDTNAEEAQYTFPKANGSTVFVGDRAVFASVTKTF